MKFRRRPFAILLLLIPAFSTTLARSVPSDSSSDAVTRSDRVGSSLPEVPLDKAAIGTKDAPVDGKDGRPHAGPWVETEARRDRKKAKEAGEEEAPLKPIAKPLKDKLASLSDGERPPELNDGVMDDPHRVGPKEGTRGTEGGVSEKSRESKTNEEKKVDPPKEAPPLPHSEQEKIDKTEKDEGATEDEKPKEEAQIAGLEVLFTLNLALRC
jgi:Ca2+/H+ antiporter, TMEM165/GDT1 family